MASKRFSFRQDLPSALIDDVVTLQHIGDYLSDEMYVGDGSLTVRVTGERGTVEGDSWDAVYESELGPLELANFEFIASGGQDAIERIHVRVERGFECEVTVEGHDRGAVGEHLQMIRAMAESPTPPTRMPSMEPPGRGGSIESPSTQLPGRASVENTQGLLSAGQPARRRYRTDKDLPRGLLHDDQFLTEVDHYLSARWPTEAPEQTFYSVTAKDAHGTVHHDNWPELKSEIRSDLHSITFSLETEFEPREARVHIGLPPKGSWAIVSSHDQAEAEGIQQVIQTMAGEAKRRQKAARKRATRGRLGRYWRNPWVIGISTSIIAAVVLTIVGLR